MNEPLVETDRVEILSSNDPDPIPNGVKGIVMSAVKFEGKMIYGVRWDNGRSLNLCEGEDTWCKI